MVLLAVLGALGIIYIMTVQLSSDVLFTSQYYQKALFKERAYYIARSAFVGVQSLFMFDTVEVDSLNDVWAMPIPPYDMPDEQVIVKVEIEDLERYLNPNVILSGSNPPKENVAIFRRLFKNLEIEPDLVNALMDWMDADQERRIPMGADGMDYPQEMPAKGAELDSIEELKLIKGLGEFYQARVVHGKSIPGLKDILTVYSNGKVNINTAGVQVLQSLDDEMTSDVVAEIIRTREGKAFRKMEDLVDVAGMNHDLIYRLKKFAGVSSSTFKFTFTVESYDGRDSAQLVGITRRGKSGGKLVFWQAQ